MQGRPALSTPPPPPPPLPDTKQSFRIKKDKRGKGENFGNNYVID